MIKMGLTFNGKPITSTAQFRREFQEVARKALGDHVKRTAQPGVRVSKTRDGYKLEGPKMAVERTMKKLGAKQRRAR